MPSLEVYAEVGGDGGCLLFTFDPPGLLARGSSLEDALKAALAEAAWLRRFLEECGHLGRLKDPWNPVQTPDFVIRETFTRKGKVANGGTTATFERDLDPLSPDEVEAYLDLMAHLRTYLRALRDHLPAAAYRFRSLPRRSTILEQLRHISYCELWYLGRFWPEKPVLARLPDPWDKLDQCREYAVERLSGLTPEEASAVRKAKGETWTARKLFRRFLYHERFHILTIQRDIDAYRRAASDSDD